MRTLPMLNFGEAVSKATSSYNLKVNGKRKQSYIANAVGIVSFKYRCYATSSFNIDD